MNARHLRDDSSQGARQGLNQSSHFVPYIVVCTLHGLVTSFYLDAALSCTQLLYTDSFSLSSLFSALHTYKVST